MHTGEFDIEADIESDINASLVTRLIAAQFPRWAYLPVRPVELSGWDNRTFHLGEDMSVRLPSARWYAAQVEKEHRWLPRLAPHLPLPIPVPLAMGVPAEGYPWHWSVYRWLAGENATIERIADLRQFMTTLAQFLAALQRLDPAGGPPPGPHNFFRGGPLSVYDAETRHAIAALEDTIDAEAATDVWETSLASVWYGPPVWVHGDVSAGNLLVSEGRLSAVIDFGSSSVGDPACDLTIAWTLLANTSQESEAKKAEAKASREAFATVISLDDTTWARARGWALWKGLITLAKHRTATSSTPLNAGETAEAKAEAAEARRVIEEVLADHQGGV